MSKVETRPDIEQILEGMRKLSEEKEHWPHQCYQIRPFVEELDDSLTCERAVDERS